MKGLFIYQTGSISEYRNDELGRTKEYLKKIGIETVAYGREYQAPQIVLIPDDDDKDAEIARLTAENAELRARLDKAVELPCAIGETVYTVIKNCTRCQHYNVGWAECRAPATAHFECESTHGTCSTQDIIDDECKKHLCVAELKFDLGLLDPKTGKLLPYYFTDREVAEARLKELEEENND